MCTGRAWLKRSGRSSSWIRRAKRLAIYHRDHFDCVHCRLVFPPATGRGDLTLDHIVPRSMGGTNEASNLVTSCWECNSSRQDTELRGEALRRAQRAATRPLDMSAGRSLARGEGVAAQQRLQHVV
jgi:5-methylcytosine-specific restriction endonuclease McrA